MINSTPFLQNASQKLAASGYQPLDPQGYQPMGYKFASRKSQFELSKFGMAERIFMFAEIPDLRGDVLQQFSSASFQWANNNKSTSLPNGFFSCLFCFAVAITENVDPQLAQAVRATVPVKHWSAFEMPVVYDTANGVLHFCETTPVWGAAYYAGFRREVQSNLG